MTAAEEYISPSPGRASVGEVIAFVVLLGAALAFTPLSVPVIVFQGTKVGYRWRDAGLLLIPVVGFVYVCRVAMGTAAWSRHYWADREIRPRRGEAEARRSAELSDPTDTVGWQGAADPKEGEMAESDRERIPVMFNDDNLQLIGEDRTYRAGSTVYTQVTYQRTPEGGYVAYGVPHHDEE